jgi:hypothetical protein
MLERHYINNLLAGIARELQNGGPGRDMEDAVSRP